MIINKLRATFNKDNEEQAFHDHFPVAHRSIDCVTRNANVGKTPGLKGLFNQADRAFEGLCF
jgi:hypothetical protein